MLRGVEGAICPRRSEEILCDAHDRHHEVGIVWAALNGRLFFDEGLVLVVQVQPRLDRDWAVSAKPPLRGQRVCKVAHFTSGIRVQSECPLDAVARGGIPFCRLETPVGEPGLSHVRREEARQRRVVKARQSTGRFDLQCYRFRSIRCRKRRGGCDQNESRDQRRMPEPEAVPQFPAVRHSPPRMSEPSYSLK
jgi:hypothetical protein